MLRRHLNEQKSRHISVKNAFQISSFQVRNFMKQKKIKIIQIFGYSGLTEKALSKEGNSSSFTVLSKKGYDKIILLLSHILLN